MTTRSGIRKAGLLSGLLAAVLLLLVGAPADLAEISADSDQAQKAWVTFCLFTLMAVWWISEALPIPVTALLPLVVLPLAGVAPLKEISGNYMHPVIVLLMGGFILAKAIERWNLHTRIALNVVLRAGESPASLVAGFMAAGALMSMWISNSATSIMLVPIGISVASALYTEGRARAVFSTVLLLAIAYSCSIGGLSTPIGTPTNLIAIAYLEESTGISISFARWMMIGIPVVLVLLPVTWFLLTKSAFTLEPPHMDEGKDIIRQKLRELGPVSTPEKRTITIISLVALAWVLRSPLQSLQAGSLFSLFLPGLSGESPPAFYPFANLSDHIIAITGVLLCFLVPSGEKNGKNSFILDWKTAESIPWGPLIMFGGGLALAFVIQSSGLGAWFGEELSILSALPLFILVLIFTAFVIFLTEIMSNVATIASLTPVLGATAVATGIDPVLVIVPVTLASSCAFMFPMATGPNAVIFGSGFVTLPDMVRAGLRVNLVSIPVITLWSVLLLPLVITR